jgi:acetyltransferase-like isoleucine patch superfamily enzyme
MQKIITLLFKILRRAYSEIRIKSTTLYAKFLLYTNNATFSKVYSNGIPCIIVARGGNLVFGENFKMNNGLIANPIGRPQPCLFFVHKYATLQIGDNVGISGTAIVVHKSVQIGNNVKIGGGVCIYDTDFHSLDYNKRHSPSTDLADTVCKPVVIHNDVFIGAHSTILKGVTIGKCSIIGAGSVVAKNIPEFEIWAGNPAKFIKSIYPD